MSIETPARDYFAGMGSAVADRTINRMIEDPATRIKRRETWGEVAERVSVGNALLEPRAPRFGGAHTFVGGVDLNEHQGGEFKKMNHHLRQASLLMSGRHLQHGDADQPNRNMEVFTNCSTAATTFLLFCLLLNGSGVGRAYDDDMIKADLNQMPIVVPVIDWGHKDVESGLISGYLTRRDADHLYAGRKVTDFLVPDTREGWAKAIEIIERMTYEGRRDEVLILDFTAVRPRNAPIMGMQGRPASGPGPLMSAITSIAKLRDAGMAPWRATIYADHYAAECVLVGGARRAARMATKTWRDKTVIDFIELKRGGFLWSSNNSVTIDAEFRDAVTKVRLLIQGLPASEQAHDECLETLLFGHAITELEAHAYRVLLALAKASYFDGTGEPGIINQDKLTRNDTGMEAYLDGLYAESAKFKLDPETLPLMRDLARAALDAGQSMITNPCGEICLVMLGAYCVIADVVPFHAQGDDDAEDAFRTATRALIRTNLMDCLYSREVKRTNRIGVGMTGFHEWVYDRFKFTWHDLVNEQKSLKMWLTVSRFKRAVVDEARRYSQELGVVVPHTNTTFKPAGTTSKLFGLCEGAHLPSMREFLRWVQFRKDDPIIAEYAAKGYPIKHLKTYEGTTIVGFPTKPRICELDGGSWVVTAAEATPEDQYEFLRLLEKYWIRGVAEDGVTPLEESGNQVSYTLKYDPQVVGFERFLETLIEGQFSIRCCSVMPQSDTSAYEYQPEQPVTKHEFEMIAAAIQNDGSTKEDIGFEHIDCGSGACPVDFNDEESVVVSVATSHPEFVVFGTEECPWCIKAKNWLMSRGLPFAYHDLDGSEARALFHSLGGFGDGERTVPRIFRYGVLIGGFDDLEAAYLKVAA